MTEELVWELFTQAGPVGKCTRCSVTTSAQVRPIFAVNVYMPKDRVTGGHQGYGFVEFKAEEDADYVGARSRTVFSPGTRQRFEHSHPSPVLS
jgi:splicing factor 3B subunit 4